MPIVWVSGGVICQTTPDGRLLAIGTTDFPSPQFADPPPMGFRGTGAPGADRVAIEAPGRERDWKTKRSEVCVDPLGDLTVFAIWIMLAGMVRLARCRATGFAPSHGGGGLL